MCEKRGRLGPSDPEPAQGAERADPWHDPGPSPRQLQAWAADDGIKAVAIRGEGPRAFCAGGDIRAVQKAMVAGNDARRRNFLRDEYRINALIGAYPKPYIALIHGI